MLSSNQLESGTRQYTIEHHVHGMFDRALMHTFIFQCFAGDHVHLRAEIGIVLGNGPNIQDQ